MPENIPLTAEVGDLNRKILRELAMSLDYPGERDWKALIGELPRDRYSYPMNKIHALELQGQRIGGSPSMSMLESFAKKLMKVGELITYLEAIDNQEALLLLKSHEPVSVTHHPSSVTKQAGEEIILKCQATGFPKPSYKWYKNGCLLPNKCSNELRLKEVGQDDGGDYFCKVTNSVGSEATNIARVQVTPAVLPSGNEESSHCRSFSDNQMGYGQEVITLHCGENFLLTCSTEAQKYQWYRNGYIIPGACGDTLHFQSFQQADEGHYSCMINVNGQDIFTVLTYLKILDSPSIVHHPELDSPPIMYYPKLDSQTIQHHPEFATGKLALLIGNEEYKTSEVHLVHPVHDVKLLQEKLESIGFKVTSLVNLTKREMDAAIDGFCNLLSCTEGIYSLFYFNGHGFEEHGKTYLVPVDAERNWSYNASICAEYVLSKIQQCGTTKLDVMLLDVCRTRELYSVTVDARYL